MCMCNYFLTKSIVSGNPVALRFAGTSETASCIYHPCSFGGCSGSALEVLHDRRLESWATAAFFRDETRSNKTCLVKGE
jgi:hypothetical protein